MKEMFRDSKPWDSAFWSIVVCACVNLAIMAGVAVRNPDYLRDFRVNSNPDAFHYVQLGRNLLVHGSYSRQEAPPFTSDALRTPVYPVFAGSLDLLGGAGAIYLAQVALHSVSCLLLYRLARPRFGSGAAFCASLLLATDLAVAVSNFEAMSETLAVFLLLSSLTWLVPAILDGGESAAPLPITAGGLSLGMAILTRPAFLYLIPLLVLLMAVFKVNAEGRLAAIRCAILLAAAAMLPVGMWTLRNAVVHSLPRLSTVDANNLVYFVGAGGYQLRHHASLKEAQALITEEFGLVPYPIAANPWGSDRSIAEIDHELRSASFEVLSRYPVEVVESSGLGILKASISHSVGQLATELGQSWSPPGFSALVRGESGVLGRLRRNGLVLIVALGWQMAHTLLSFGAAAWGIVRGLGRRETRAMTLLTLMLLAYGLLTIGLFGLEAYYRCRIPALPFLFLCAGYGMTGWAVGLGRIGLRLWH